MPIALTACMGRGREGGVLKRRVQEQNGLVIITNIYNLFKVSLFHSDETFHVYACARSVFQIRSMKKAVTFLKMVIKKIVFITKCNEKNCFKRVTLQKKIVCKSQKW